jgi:DNA repair exonuclease SbcCD ATPase subunit
MDSKVWFYDDREYYNYVLLNGSEDVYAKVQQALKANKVRVLKAAASFRPASNGIQYKWYIRIEGENFKPPTREQIKSIVEGVLTPEVKVVAEQLPVVLQTQINSLNSDIKKLQSELVQKNKEIENAKRLHELEIKNLQSNLDVAKSELTQSVQSVNELRQQIKDTFNLDDVTSLENQYKAQVKELESRLDSAKQELKDYIDNFQGELNRRDVEIATLIKERDGYISEIQSGQEITTTNERDGSQSLFFSAVKVLLPNIEFLRSSLDFAWNNFSNLEMERILSAVQQIESPHMRAERVKSAPDWKEYHSERVTWRIYFRQCKSKQYQVLISDKDTQEKRDWDWLKNQPKTC